MKIIEMLMFIFIFIGAVQLATFIHELGHAIPPLIFSNGEVYVLLGKKRKNRLIHIGRLTIDIGGFAPMTGYIYWDDKEMTKLELAMFGVAGPMMSLIWAVALHFCGARADASVIQQMLLTISWYFFAQFLVTAIPMKYPSFFFSYIGFSSDGYQVWRLLKMK